MKDVVDEILDPLVDRMPWYVVMGALSCKTSGKGSLLTKEARSYLKAKLLAELKLVRGEVNRLIHELESEK